MHERFARAVDGAADAEFADELRIVARLRSGAHTVRLPASSRDRIARQLRASMTTDRRRPRFAAVACCLLIVLAAIGLLSAHTALPGDALYPVKRGIEEASVGLSAGDSAKANTRLELASDRISELSAITARGPVAGESADLRSALDVLDAQASAAARLITGEETNAALGALSTWTANARARLGEVPGMPSVMAARVRRSQRLLDNISERSSALRARLDCTAITSGEQDSFGAVPASDRCTQERASSAPASLPTQQRRAVAFAQPDYLPRDTRIAPPAMPVSAPLPLAPSVPVGLPGYRQPPGPPPPVTAPTPPALDLGPLLG